MAIIKWNPWNPFDDFEEIFNRLPMAPKGEGMNPSFIPALDVYQTDKNIMVEAALPGLRPEEVEVSVEKGVLTIKGESKKEHEVDEKDYYRKEVRSGSFFRQVALPAAVQEDKVTAEYEEGILKITAPKAPSAVQKKIAVKVSKKEDKKKK